MIKRIKPTEEEEFIKISFSGDKKTHYKLKEIYGEKGISMSEVLRFFEKENLRYWEMLSNE